jgi:hypothetical protein
VAELRPHRLPDTVLRRRRLSGAPCAPGRYPAMGLTATGGANLEHGIAPSRLEGR